MKDIKVPICTHGEMRWEIVGKPEEAGWEQRGSGRERGSKCEG